MQQPETYRPLSADQFIGDAHRVVTKLGDKIRRGNLAGQRWLFLGEPGIGKSAAALALAAMIVQHPTCVEQVNGQSCSVDLVRQWRDNLHSPSMFGPTVKILDELDLASLPAQHELLTVLDRLPPWQHVIATTNKKLDALTPRLQSRFQQWPFSPPPVEEIGRFIVRFGINANSALAIASGAAGNVRASLLDAQSALDMA